MSLAERVIGQRVRIARKAMNLRQSDLSQMAGLSASHLSGIERAAITPSIPTLHKIGDALGRPLVYFLQAAEDEPRSMGMVIHLTSIGGQGAARFAELVEQNTGGEFKVRIYHHSALGSAREQVIGLAEGAIGIYVDELLSFEHFAELCGPVCLPYFFRDKEHFHKFLQSSIFEEFIFRRLLDNGIRLLKPVSSWESGPFEMLLSATPAFAPQDLAGRKFRSYESEAAIALRRALGADPVVVEWAKAPQAFERGLIDTFLVPVSYLSSLRPQEFANYATMLDYGYTVNLTVAVGEREYARLSPDVQQALVEAAQGAGAYCSRLVEEEREITVQLLSNEQELPVIQPDPGAWRRSFTTAIRKICEEGLLPIEIYEDLQSL